VPRDDSRTEARWPAAAEPQAATGARIAAGLVAAGLVTAGLRERGTAFTSRSTGSPSAAVALSAVFAAFLALGMLWILTRSMHRRRKRSPEEDEHRVEAYPPSRWSRPLALLAVLVVLALPALLLWATLKRVEEPGSTPLPTTAPSATATGPTQPLPSAGSQASVWLLVLAGGVVAGILLLGVVARLLHRAGDTGGPAQRPSSSAAARAPVPNLDDPDPRRAVVASYRAFEDAAATHGVPIGASDTARDIARNAVSEQVAPRADLADLTHLFYLARYSTHPIGPTERDRARALLARLRDDMSRTP